MTSPLRQTVMFDDLAAKPISIVFRQPDQSSDGGLVLLQAVDKRLRLSQRLAAALRDSRQSGKVQHSVQEMLRSRIFAVASGYPDCNDIGTLKCDPVLRLACAVEGSLASQPTLSRFENSVSRTDLLRMAYAFTDLVLEDQIRHRNPRKVREITVDMDSTEDPTYGNQQQTFFNAFYDNWCYLPMVSTIQFGNEPEHWMIAPVLRPGNAKGSSGAIAILKRVLPKLRERFPRAHVRARLDGAFAAPEIFDWLESQGVEYVVNMPKNSVLARLAEPLMAEIRKLALLTNKTQTAHSVGRYQASTWKTERRVIIKAEVTCLEGREPRDNPRFLVTNGTMSPRRTYEYYAARGDVENRVKELHYGLDFDRTSCSTFEANQFRNLIVAAAYALYQQLRRAAAKTTFERAQVPTLRERLIKIGVVVLESVRRILLNGPLSFPWQADWARIARAVGAVT